MGHKNATYNRIQVFHQVPLEEYKSLSAKKFSQLALQLFAIGQ
jgi:hypothetical protein